MLIKNWFPYKLLVAYIHKATVVINPKSEMERVYKKVFHRMPNIDNPNNLIEKIYWLQLHSDTSLWTKCADKYQVREYLHELGMDQYLPKLYGKWDSANDIDFDQLPEKYILKTNNGCGTCIIVRNNDKNPDMMRKRLKEWMIVPYGWSGAQIHYTRIKPCIIAEQLLENSEKDNVVSPSSLIDYKIWCFNGEPESIFVVYNRNGHYAKIALYDTDWNMLDNKITPTVYKTIDLDSHIERPKCLDEMLILARKLSAPFKEVRVDLYVVEDKPVFGELTFTTGYGYFTEEYYNYLGSKFEIG